MEKKTIKKLLVAAGLLAAICPSAHADDIDGYFRIQNGYGVTANGGTADGGHYVQQSDLFYAAPNLTAEDAKSKPGSIFYIKAVEQSDGSYKILQLRSQGVELIGDNKEPKTFSDFYNTVFKPLVDNQGNDTKADTRYQALRAAGAEGYLFTTRALIESFIYDVAQTLKDYASNPNSPYYSGLSNDERDEIVQNIETIVDSFNIQVANKLDIDAYLVPTKLSDNTTDAYYLKIHALDFKKVTDFFNKTKNMELFKAGLDAMRNELGSSSSGETLDAFEIPIYYKLGYNLYENFAENTPDNPWTGTYNGRGSMNTDQNSPLYCTGQMSYEMIFTHPKLLFGWVKMQLYKMMAYPDNYNNPIGIFGHSETASPQNYKNTYLYKFFKELGEDPVFMSYFERYPYDQDVYIIDGYLSSDGSDETVPGDNYKALGRFGFTRNDAHTDYSTYYWDGSTGLEGNNPKVAHENQTAIAVGKGADNAKDGAKWILKQLSPKDGAATGDGLKVTASSRIKGVFDGHYYTTLYVDFPIDIAASRALNPGIRFYGIGSTVNTGTTEPDKEGKTYTYKYVTVDSLTDYVPKGQPVIVEVPEADDINNIVAVADASEDGTYDVKSALLKGVFFNVGKSNAVTDDANRTYAQKEEDKLADWFDYDGNITEDQRLERELVNRVGLNPIDKGLIYTLQKSTLEKDKYNPIGFYKYDYKTLSANKAFIFVAKESTGGVAKIAIGGNGEATGINQVNAATDSNKPVVIYDLSGRRVSNPTTGIYIINGKKVLISK